MVAAALEVAVTRLKARLETTDGVDSSASPEAQLMRTLLDAISQYERASIKRRIKRRIKAALRAKKARGEQTGGVPFGFSAEGKVLIQNPHEQVTIARIRSLRSSGLSVAAIVEQLHRAGLEARGQRWHATTVSRILHDARHLMRG